MDPRAFLHHVRSRLRRVVMADGLARLAAAVIALAALVVLFDKKFELPGVVRGMALLGIVIAAVIVVRKRLWRPLHKSLDDSEIARFCEARLPSLDGRLFSSINGIAMTGRDADTIAQTLRREAIPGLVPAVTLPRNAAIAVLAIVAVAVFGWFKPTIFGEGLSRLLLPFGSTEWTRSSALSLTLDRTVIASDERVVASVTRTKGEPAALRLSWMADSGEELRTLAGLSGPWTQSLSLPLGQQRVTAHSGDALDAVATVLVVARPTLAGATTRIVPPAYTGRPVQTQASPAANVLPGSQITVNPSFITAPGRALKSIRVTLPDGTLQTITGSTGEITFIAMVAGTLRIDAEDQDGIGILPAPTFAVKLDTDRNPNVTIDGVSKTEAVAPTARIATTITAIDDYGLDDVHIVLTKLAASSATASLTAPALPKPNGARSMKQPALLDIATMAIPGEMILMQALATDRNSVTGPGLGKSEVITITVVSAEAFRKELEQQFRDALSRISEARESLANGQINPDKLIPQARQAGLSTASAQDRLRTAIRRAQMNLPEAQLSTFAPSATAASALDLAQKDIVTAATNDREAAKRADDQLNAAELAIKSMLTEGDMARELGAMIERQKQLNNDTNKILTEALTKPANDPVMKERIAALGDQQAKNAAAVRELQRQIAASTSPTMEAAKAHAAQTNPGDQLQSASRDLAGANRSQAPETQKQATANMEKLLDLLRGIDQNESNARKLGELAARQEALAAKMDNPGSDPTKNAKEQEKLRHDTEQLSRTLDPETKELTDAAQAAQAAAESAASKGDKASAAASARAAAALLRQAQKKKSPPPQSEEEKEKAKSTLQILVLLRELLGDQLDIFAKASTLHKVLGEKEPDFTQTRAITALGKAEAEKILLRLKEEAGKELEGKQELAIIAFALQRVITAVDGATVHLNRPALGGHGIRLLTNAVAELQRIIDVADAMPPPEKEEDKKGGGGGGGGGGGQQPPFPPAVQLALLADMQAQVAEQVGAGRPVDVATAQGYIVEMTELIEHMTRPGTRPNILMARAGRAVRSAHARLENHDQGAATRLELQAAENAIRRVMAEAKAGGGGQGKPGEDDGQKPKGGPKDPSDSSGSSGSSGGGNPAGSDGNPAGSKGGPSSGQPGAGQPGEGKPGEAPPGEGKPGEGKPGDGTPGSTVPGDVGNASGNQANGGGTTTQVDPNDNGRLMNLGPQDRERIKQVLHQNLTPEIMEIYKRYLSNLQEQP